MRTHVHRPILVALLLFPVLTSCGPSTPPVPDVHVRDAWARPSRTTAMGSESPDSTAAGSATSAIYLSLHNGGGAADTVLSARTDIARAVEIHESRMDGGIMRMRRAEEIEIPAGGTIAFRPGGLHVMLIGLTRDLAVGDTFVVKLDLAQSGEQSADVVVRQPE